MNQHLSVSENDRAIAPVSAPDALYLGAPPAKASYETPQLIAHGHLCNLTLSDPCCGENCDGAPIP